MPHDPRAANPTSLKESLQIAVDEMLTALEESLAGLSEASAWARPAANRHAIGTLVMHLLDNIDRHGVEIQIGRRALPREERFDLWFHRDPADPRRATNLPTVAEMLGRIRTVREAVMASLAAAPDADLLGPRAAERDGWWTEHHRSSAAGYARIVHHANAHLRQIWALRGMLGAISDQGWPRQHYH